MSKRRKNQYAAAVFVLAIAVLFVSCKNSLHTEQQETQTSVSSAETLAENSVSETESGTDEISDGAAKAEAEEEPDCETASEPEEHMPFIPGQEEAGAPLVGVWVPYMSLSCDGTEEGFKRNFDEKLEAAKNVGANALFVHVRPFADSLYPSGYEVWSHLLTGTQGVDPGYDPLAYMVEAAHAAGMEFHAWINPLRISTGYTPAVLAEESFYVQNKKTAPYYFMEYNGGVYYNPASDLVRERIADGAAEIALKYDVDGIHFDDYFYPTAEEGPDADMYAAYCSGTEEPLPLHEWRTANINALIASVYRKVKAADPNVVFGISPQGNLRNNEKINADVYTWCAQAGYIDYICPQLYYSFENPALPFEQALAEWNAIPRHEDVKLYIGLGAYKAGTDADSGTWLDKEDTLKRQIEKAAEISADGVIIYAVDDLTREAAAAEIDNAEEAIDVLCLLP